MPDNKILEITNDVKWIGILDYDIVTFDIVMETQYGTTYNSFYINALREIRVDFCIPARKGDFRKIKRLP